MPHVVSEVCALLLTLPGFQSSQSNPPAPSSLSVQDNPFLVLSC